jgi:hypothetical protein
VWAASGAPDPEVRLTRRESAFSPPWYGAGSVVAVAAAAEMLAKAAEEADRMPSPRARLILDYSTVSDRLERLLPGLAVGGSVHTLFDEALHTGFLAGSPADAMPFAMEAARRLTEHPWLPSVLALTP